MRSPLSVTAAAEVETREVSLDPLEEDAEGAASALLDGERSFLLADEREEEEDGEAERDFGRFCRVALLRLVSSG